MALILGIIMIGAGFTGVWIILQSLWALVSGTTVTLYFYGSSSTHTWYEGIGYGVLHLAIVGVIYLFGLFSKDE